MPLHDEKTIDGITLLKFCRETGRNTPFLLVSGDNFVEFSLLEKKYKNFRYLAKPYLPSNLISQVRDLAGVIKEKRNCL